MSLSDEGRRSNLTDVWNGFESFWYRDYLAEQASEGQGRSGVGRPQTLSPIPWEECTIEKPCAICREALALGSPSILARFGRSALEEWQAETESTWTPRFNRGDEIEVDAPGDPNHRRVGPIWQPAIEPGGMHEVWFEDGIQPYSDGQLIDKDFNHDIDHLPEIRPKGWKPTTPNLGPAVAPGSATDSVAAVEYPHPYHIYARNQLRGKR